MEGGFGSVSSSSDQNGSRRRTTWLWRRASTRKSKRVSGEDQEEGREAKDGALAEALGKNSGGGESSGRRPSPPCRPSLLMAAARVPVLPSRGREGPSRRCWMPPRSLSTPHRDDSLDEMTVPSASPKAPASAGRRARRDNSY